jgi:hypothetical protein
VRRRSQSIRVRPAEPLFPGEAAVLPAEPLFPGEAAVLPAEPLFPGEAAVLPAEALFPGEAVMFAVASLTWPTGRHGGRIGAEPQEGVMTCLVIAGRY